MTTADLTPDVPTVPLPAKVAPEWHHHHEPTEEEISVAAYFLWLGEGCPWGNDELTFANWLDGKGDLENKHFPPPPPPTE